MLRLAILMVVLTLVPNAFAGWQEGVSRNLEDKLVLCERRLERDYIGKREAALREEVFGRPFIGWIVHDMTPAGLKKTGLDPSRSERDLQDLVLVVERSEDGGSLEVKLKRYHAGEFHTELDYVFSAPNLAGYDALNLRAEHDGLGYQEMIREYPLQSTRLLRRIGYHSAPDPSGVRHYIAFVEHPGSGDRVSCFIEFGIDVPYATARMYSQDLGEVTDEMRTESGRYIRIATLAFARVD